MSFQKLAKYYDDLSKEDNSIELLKMGKDCLLKKEFQKAFDYLKSASLLGNSDAQRYLGLLYLKNEGKIPSIAGQEKIGIEYLELSAKQQNKKTLFLLGILYIEGFKENNKKTRKSFFGFNHEAQEQPINPNSPKPDKDLGIKYIQQAIDLKYRRAMKYLFDYYFRERHIENNLEKAENLAKDAIHIGYKYLIENLLEQYNLLEPEKQLNIIKYLADHGDPKYQRMYGDFLYHHSNDFENGYGYLKRSADKGEAYSMYLYGFYNLIGYSDNHGDREEGFKYLEKAARNGCLAASYYLGLFHLHSDHGLPKNEKKAIKYFHRAAIYMDPDAQIALGKVFLYNEKWLNIPNLAVMYFGYAAEGHILKKNEFLLAEWPEYSDDDDFEQGSDSEEEENDENSKDDEDDKYNVEVLHMLYPDIPESSTEYEEPRKTSSYMVIPKNKQKKREYDHIYDIEDLEDPLVRQVYNLMNEDINKRINQKKKKVKVFIGAYAGEFSKKGDQNYVTMNYKCQGLIGLGQAYKEQKNYKMSLLNYTKAINFGSSEAMNELGNIYKDGSYGKREPQKAMELFKKAYTECRNPDALYYLGRMYLDGCGVERDPVKGNEFIRSAMNQGSTVAHRNFQHGGFMSFRFIC